MLLHDNVKLGRVKPDAEKKKKRFMLSSSRMTALPPAPESIDFTTGPKGSAQYGMHLNNIYGCCTVAGLANYFATCAAQEDGLFTISDDEVKDFYFEMTGGVDNGLYEGDVLTRAKTTGFPKDGRYKLVAWVGIDPQDIETMKSLASLFWCLYLGVQLPNSAKNQVVWAAGSDLDGDNAPGSWGDHCVVMPKYDQSGPTYITWGAQKPATWDWHKNYIEEVNVALDAKRASMIGVDWDQLLADMQAASL